MQNLYASLYVDLELTTHNNLIKYNANQRLFFRDTKPLELSLLFQMLGCLALHCNLINL